MSGTAREGQALGRTIAALDETAVELRVTDRWRSHIVAFAAVLRAEVALRPGQAPPGRSDVARAGGLRILDGGAAVGARPRGR